MNHKKVIIATRSSQLALWQANWVADSLRKHHPELLVELLPLVTTADKSPYLSLAASGGKGLFVKELEEALLAKRADIAVHSIKDVPVIQQPGLVLPVICKRELPWDVMVSNQFTHIAELPAGAVVGTSSLRRQSQLLALRSDLTVHGLRGNVNTRLARLDQGDYAAIILAAAGLQRLGFESRMTAMLSDEEFLPAAGQGALAIECRENDNKMIERIAMLNDLPTAACVRAERAVCRKLEADCQVPMAAFAVIQTEQLVLRGLVASVDGQSILRAESTGKIQDAEAIGETVAIQLLAQGAEKLLKPYQ